MGQETKSEYNQRGSQSNLLKLTTLQCGYVKKMSLFLKNIRVMEGQTNYDIQTKNESTE